jgi:beta-N-acetylhexosaminidase
VPAAFSHTIVTGMLRGDLGFTGVVISDDLGKAAQVADVPVGDRAIRFIEAGGDLVICVNPTGADSVDPMLDALTAKATSDPTFRALLVASATRILTEKQAMGLHVG